MRRGLAGVGCAAVLAASVLGPQAAAAAPNRGGVATYQADGRIRKGTKPYIGDTVINLTGDGQTVTKNLSPGQSVHLGIRVRNAGLNGGDPLRVFTSGNPNNANIKVTFSYKGKDVTDRVVDAQFKFGGKVIAAGESTPRLDVEVKARPHAPGGSGFTSFNAQSYTNSVIATRDVVRLYYAIVP